MHPNLLVYPNNQFYASRLCSDTSCEQISEVTGFPWSGKQRTAFIHYEFLESRESRSYYNDYEAKMIEKIILKLVKSGSIQTKDIVILSPYKAQIKLLQKTLSRHFGTACIEVQSIDAYQGQQADVVLLSTVRSNDGGHIGFLADEGRVNVAMTRAVKAFFVVGNYKTLLWGDNPQHMWRNFFEANGYYIGESDGYLKKQVTHEDLDQLMSGQPLPLVHPRDEESQVYESSWIQTAYLPLNIAIEKMIFTMGTWIDSTRKLLEHVAFKVVFSHVQSLTKKRTGEYNKCLLGQPHSRKKLSHSGSVYFHGNSKNRDPTNLVYYITFQIIIRNWLGISPTDNDWRDRYYKQYLPQLQLEKLKSCKHCEGVLNDTGDILEAMSTIADVKTKIGGPIREFLQSQNSNLQMKDFQSLYHLISLVVKDAKRILDISYTMETVPAWHTGGCEFSLLLVRWLLRSEANVLENRSYFAATIRLVQEEALAYVNAMGYEKESSDTQ